MTEINKVTNMAENIDIYEPKRIKYSFQNERIVRSIFERLLDVKFPKIRGLFSNPKMELDGYCDTCGNNSDIKIAFEYQGEQHYNYVPYFHGENPDIGYINLQKQQENDMIKQIECQLLGINLIEIPFYVKNKEMFIKAKISAIFKSKGICDWEPEEIILDEEQETIPNSLDMCEKTFKKIITQNFEEKHILNLPITLVDFLHKFILTDSNGNNMYFNQNNTQVFYYFGKNGEKIYDWNGHMFWNTIKDPLYSAIHTLLNKKYCTLPKNDRFREAAILLELKDLQANLSKLKNGRIIMNLIKMLVLQGENPKIYT